MVSSITGIRIPTQHKRKADKQGEGDGGSEATTESENQEDDQEDESAKVHPGIAIWVAFSIPSCLATNVEAMVTQIVQSSCLSPVQCKVILRPILGF